MKLILLSGGLGSGLWPLSREDYPKQFLDVLGGQSLLELTLDRFLPFFSPQDVWIVTQKDQRFLVEREVRKFGIPPDQFILEPVARGTGPAVYLTIRTLVEQFGILKEPVLVASSDHFIREKDLFLQQVVHVLDHLDRERLTLFGVNPRESHPDFGYIRLGEPKPKRMWAVKEYIEELLPSTIDQLIKQGHSAWNCGIYAFTPATFLRLWRDHCSDLIADGIELSDLLAQYHALDSFSLSKILTEPARDCLCYLLTGITWSDIGTFDHLFDLIDRTPHSDTPVHTLESFGNLVLGQKRKLTVLIGVEDLTVVDTDDVLLLIRRGEGYRIKELIGTLRQDKIPQLKKGLTSYRPWGYFKILEEWPRFKIKRLVIYPGECLSLQLHYHRTEHWIVVSGTARALTGETEHLVHEGENVFIPKSCHHRLENPGKVDLEVIEVQNGEYLGEDDIQRFEDKWDRG